MKDRSTEKVAYLTYTEDRLQPQEKPLVRETAWTIHVNGQELVTILCTPNKMNFLVLGFLASERIIQSLDDVGILRVCEDEGNVVDVRLRDNALSLPRRRVLLSGCGGGVTFEDLTANHARLTSSLTITPAQISKLMRDLQRSAEVYRATGGIHASALSDGERLLVVAEDVGRHNTLDKIRGECIYHHIPTKDRIILTTGRISSEMANKAVGMETPILISRTSPTDLAVRLADSWGITLVGYARGKRMNLYTHPERITSME
ncbi:MAG: formate dehydrogenase accessory sulfurtransferase FdhD [Anaerolineae bacterium]